jgi:OPT family oligopeptide transporter
MASPASSTAVKDRSHTEVEQDLSNFAEEHTWDPNFDPKKIKEINKAIQEHDPEAEITLEHELEELSPYPEVNAAVQNFDDTSLDANTLRAWIIGMLFVTIGSAMNMLFSLRKPTIAVGTLVCQISSYPVGLFFAKIMPRHQFNTFGLKWTLNPGPFNKKEHAFITVMSNVSFAGGAAYSTFALEAMRGFYHLNWGTGFAILLTLCTQMTGVAMAGLFRRFMIEPSFIIYPNVLPNCALFNTLHDPHKKMDPAATNGWSISRFRWYFYVLTGAFSYYWLPGWLFQAMSNVSWVTWIKPNNVIVNQLMGSYNGLSLGAPFTGR